MSSIVWFGVGEIDGGGNIYFIIDFMVIFY